MTPNKMDRIECRKRTSYTVRYSMTNKSPHDFNIIVIETQIHVFKMISFDPKVFGYIFFLSIIIIIISIFLFKHNFCCPSIPQPIKIFIYDARWWAINKHGITNTKWATHLIKLEQKVRAFKFKWIWRCRFCFTRSLAVSSITIRSTVNAWRLFAIFQL